jgi:hypothetical protein
MILKYLNPSPATAKGYMKRPHYGIQSTAPKMLTMGIAPIPTIPVHLPHVLPLFQQPPPYQEPAYDALQGPNLIGMDDNESIANVFCFGLFVDKNNGVVYNDLMGSFLFISLDGSICFFIMYHYKANAILAKPISGLDDISIFNAYKVQFKDLISKGFKPKINIIDNQVTKHIKAILTKQKCKLQLVEPLWRELYKPSRMPSLLCLPQPIVTPHCNYGQTHAASSRHT